MSDFHIHISVAVGQSVSSTYNLNCQSQAYMRMLILHNELTSPGMVLKTGSNLRIGFLFRELRQSWVFLPEQANNSDEHD
jgi:hypothetical protein